MLEILEIWDDEISFDEDDDKLSHVICNVYPTQTLCGKIDNGPVFDNWDSINPADICVVCYGLEEIDECVICHTDCTEV